MKRPVKPPQTRQERQQFAATSVPPALVVATRVPGSLTSGERDGAIGPNDSMVAKDSYQLPGLKISGLHAQALQEMGLAIVDGQVAPGQSLTIEELEQRLGVSRSVVRECLRTLSALGMVESRRRVGVTVLPMAEWNVYDLNVVRWRLESGRRNQQLQSITELRNAIEPEAVRLACLRATHAEAADLVAIAGQLWSAGKQGNNDDFLNLDIAYHQFVLRLSGNEMFAKLQSMIAEILVGRSNHGLMPQFPHEEALQLHVDIAHAVQRRDADGAALAMHAILDRTFSEMGSIWQASGGQEPFGA